MKIVYQTDEQGFLVGVVEADESPLEPGVWLIPRGAVEQPPPEPRAGQHPFWTGSAWELRTPPAAAAPPPLEPELPRRRTCTPLAFLERFTQVERIAIRRAARANDALEDWLDMLRAAQEVDLDDPRTQAGVRAMVEARLITPERAAEVLA